MDSKTIRTWGQVAVSVFALVLLGICLIEAFRQNDPAMKNLLVGAVIGYAGAAVTFYIGSSASSQQKDDVIAASNPPPRGP
jgi:xanthine/uracil permease